jgi:hypothetical protein
MAGGRHGHGRGRGGWEADWIELQFSQQLPTAMLGEGLTIVPWASGGGGGGVPTEIGRS